MQRALGSTGKGGSSSTMKRGRREDNEEIIRVPAFDNSDLIEKFKLTLVGRMFHSDGRSVEALLKHMPKRRIWDVEGRVKGTNLGNDKFQFDFDKEEDLLKVLQRRPCHFNKWSFSLERWIPTIKEDFPNMLLLWATVSGIPIHYKKLETYQSVGSALGTYDSADIEGGRVKVFINGDLPLKFECKVGFDNGDVVKVTIKYEDLHRHCYTCKRITHEEGTCPNLSEVQREKNRLLRIEQKDQEERATKEAFSTPYRRNAEVYQSTTNHRDSRDRERRSDSSYQQYQRRERRYEERHGQETSHDLCNRLTDRREAQSKDVWNRLDNSTRSELPRNRERYHPYHNSSRVESRGKHRDTGSSSEWRPKERQEMRTESYLNYANQKEKHVERFENHSYRRRISPDSQCTISENVQSKWQRGHLGGRRSRSPPTHMEWRPVRKDKATTPTSTPRDQGLEERRNNGQVGFEGLTETGIADDETNVEKEAATLIPSLEKESDTNINVRTEVAKKVLGANSSHLSNCEHGYTTKDKEEDDIDKIIDEYAELAMNEEPVDDDDLLDEISEGEIPEKENLAAEQDTEDGRIEAILQLSPSRATSLSRPENMKQSAALGLKVTSQEITTKRSWKRIIRCSLLLVGREEDHGAQNSKEHLRPRSWLTEDDCLRK